FVQLIEHYTPILKSLSLGVIIKSFLSILPIHITERNDIFCLHVGQITPTHSSNTYSSNIKLITRRNMSQCLSQDMTRNDAKPGQSGTAFYKIPSRQVFFHYFSDLYLLDISISKPLSRI